MVTGANPGVGYQLAKILYLAGAKVYLAVRSEARATKTIRELRSLVASASAGLFTGELEYLHLELDDLSSIKSTAETFMQRESRLDVLWNNAAVSLPPMGSRSKQGHELQLITNCLGPYLLTQVLLPVLKATAARSPGTAAVRVIWSSSIVVDMRAPKRGIIFSDLDSTPPDQTRNYVTSRTGNWFLASELAHDISRDNDNMLSITQNPGNLSTNLLRHTSSWYRLIVSPLLYRGQMGAYTELWSGLSPDITMEMNGGYMIPWGRVHPGPREDILVALKGIEEGGSGLARKFREWCESKVVEFR